MSVPTGLEPWQEAHAERVRALDPLAPTGLPMPNDTSRLLVAVSGAVGALSTVATTDPDSPAALWGSTTVITLALRARPDADEGDIADVCAQWEREVLADVDDDPDTAALVTWPSRDLLGQRTFLTHHLSPVSQTAIRVLRPGAEPALPTPPGLTIRRAEVADVDALLEPTLALHAADVAFGSLTPRPRQRELQRAELAEHVAHDLVLLAEDADGPAGHLVCQPPERSAWMASRVAVGRFSYLSALWTEPRVRGTGVGAALYGAGLAWAREQRVAAFVLHHALASPWSTHTWHRQGFRPLWTTYQRRPVTRG